jgi:hypothetical protein
MNQAFGSPLQSMPTSPLDLADSDSDSMTSAPDDVGTATVFQKVEVGSAGTHSPEPSKGNNVSSRD